MAIVIAQLFASAFSVASVDLIVDIALTICCLWICYCSVAPVMLIKTSDSNRDRFCVIELVIALVLDLSDSVCDANFHQLNSATRSNLQNA